MFQWQPPWIVCHLFKPFLCQIEAERRKSSDLERRLDEHRSASPSPTSASASAVPGRRPEHEGRDRWRAPVQEETGNPLISISFFPFQIWLLNLFLTLEVEILALSSIVQILDEWQLKLFQRATDPSTKGLKNDYWTTFLWLWLASELAAKKYLTGAQFKYKYRKIVLQLIIIIPQNS